MHDSQNIEKEDLALSCDPKSIYLLNVLHSLSLKSKPCISGTVNRLLLLLAGDVEENPGPFGMCHQLCSPNVRLAFLFAIA